MVKVRLSAEFDCPECGKLGFDSYTPDGELVGVITCKHCKTASITAEHPSFETAASCDDFVLLRAAWEFDCPACKKLSYASFVSYKPPLEGEVNGCTIQVVEFKPRTRSFCQHCGVESPTDGKIY